MVLLSLLVLLGIILVLIVLSLKKEHDALPLHDQDDSLYSAIISSIKNTLPDKEKLRSRNYRAKLFASTACFIGVFMLGIFWKYFILIWMVTGCIMFIGSVVLLQKNPVSNIEQLDTFWDDESLPTYFILTIICSIAGLFTLVFIIYGVNYSNDSFVS